MTESHSDGDVLGKFCALRTKRCKDGEEYQENCDPKPTGWASYYFWQGSEYSDGTNTTVKKTFEAHHLLCVAAVTEHIVGCTRISKVVKETDWCINNTVNMFAMPLWGHTIKYYCTIEWKSFFEEHTPWFLDKKGPPKFANIPMHDQDHDLYIEEVEKKLIAIAKQVKTAKKQHKIEVSKLKDRLDAEARHFRGELQTRGSTRCGGTHKAWQDAKKAYNDWASGGTPPSLKWYEPFSMAAKPRKRYFPGLRKKMIDRANSFLVRLTS